VRGEAARVAERTRAVLAGAVDAGAGEDVHRWVDDPDAAPMPAAAAPVRHRRRSRWVGVEALRDRVRWDPGRRGTAAVAAVALVAVLVTVWQVARSRPQPVSIQTGPGGLGSAVAAVSGGPDGLRSAAASRVRSSAPTLAPAVLVVDVAGKVRRPGVYRLPPGSRVLDALRAAGGARRSRDTASLNLAAPLTDGQQIVVGTPAAGQPDGAAVGPAGSSGTAAAAVVGLNSATLEQLETLPGVGPVLGQNILDWRDAHGRFNSVDQLRDVTGIGDVRFAQLQPLVRLS
jgi:competence protein ComEA